MADLKKLKKTAEDLKKILGDLYEKANQDADAGSESKEIKAVENLLAVTNAAGDPTPGEFELRIGAIKAVRSLLTEFLIQATTTAVSLNTPQFRRIDDQRLQLRESMNTLLRQEVFGAIPNLLTKTQIKKIGKTLEGAKEEIRERKAAKKRIDTAISVALTIGEIAMKLA